MPSVYDDERQKIDGVSSGNKLGPEREQVNDGLQPAFDEKLNDILNGGGFYKPKQDKKSLEGEDLKQSENTIGNGYDSDDGSSRSIFSKLSGKRKKAAGVGIIGGGLIAVVMFLISIMTGPLQMIHFAEVLQKLFLSRVDDTHNGRTSKFLLYKFVGSAEMGRLGVSGNIMANRAEVRLNERVGLKSTYDANGRLTGYDVIDRSKASETIRQLEAEGFDTNNATRVELPRGSGTNYKPSRVVTRLVVGNAGYTSVTSRVSSRLLERRGGVNFHPMVKFARNKVDNRTMSREEAEKQRLEEEAAVREAQAKAAGIDTPDNPISDTAKKRSILSSKFVQLGGAAVGAVAIVCSVNEFSQSISAQDLENQKQILRIGMSIVTKGNQAKSGQDMDQINAKIASENFYDPVSKTSLLGSSLLQKELGKTATGPIPPDELKPGYNAENKPGIFKVLDGITGVDTTCAGYDATTGFIGGLPGIKQLGQFASDAVELALKSLGLKSIDEYYAAVLAKFTFTLLDYKGAEFGNVAAMSLRSAANQQMIATGGVSVPDGEAIEYNTMLRKERLAQTSIFGRYFDVHNSDSVTARIAVNAPTDTDQLASSFNKIPSMFSSILGSVYRFSTGTVNAAPTTDEYGFSNYGFTIAELENESYDSPYVNGQKVVNLLNVPCTPDVSECGEKWISNVKQCFGTDITRDGSGAWQVLPNNASDMIQYADIDKLNSGDLYNILSSCADKKSNWTSIRFFILDTTVANSGACYEGDEEACNIVGMGDSVPTFGEAKFGSAPANLPQGDLKLLAQALLDSPNVSISNANALLQIQAVASNGVGEIDPIIIRVLSALSQNHQFTISSLKRCTGSIGAGLSSRHCVGKAVDISGRAGIDGSTFDYSGQDPKAQQFASDVASLLPGGCEIGLPNSLYVNTTRPQAKAGCNVFVDEGTAPHIHIGAPR